MNGSIQSSNVALNFVSQKNLHLTAFVKDTFIAYEKIIYPA